MRRERATHKKSSTETKSFDKLGIAILVFARKIVEETTAATDHPQEPTARRMVLRILLHVLRKSSDLRREDRNLDFRRSDVGFTAAILGDERLLFLFTHNRHRRNLYYRGKSTSNASQRNRSIPQMCVNRLPFGYITSQDKASRPVETDTMPLYRRIVRRQGGIKDRCGVFCVFSPIAATARPLAIYAPRDALAYRRSPTY